MAISLCESIEKTIMQTATLFCKDINNGVNNQKVSLKGCFDVGEARDGGGGGSVGGLGSEFNSKETIQHSTDDLLCDFRTYKSQIYRFRNLVMADILELSDFADNKIVDKGIRSLRYCSSVIIVQDHGDVGGIEILNKSKTCKHPLCSICQWHRGNQGVDLLRDFLNDPENERLLKLPKYALTLTMRHTWSHRSEPYHKELKSCYSKLKRQKFNVNNKLYGFDEIFVGGLDNFEDAFSVKTGLQAHIHTFLIQSPGVYFKVADLQAQLKEKWEKLTGDSYQVCLDYLGCDFSERIKETVKYSFKVSGDLVGIRNGIKADNLDNEQAGLIGNCKGNYKRLANLIAMTLIATKGLQRHVKWGVMNGVCKGDLSEKLDEDNSSTYMPAHKISEKIERGDPVYAGSLVELSFNYTLSDWDIKDKRKEIRCNVRCVGVPDSFIKLDEKMIMPIVKVGWTESRFKDWYREYVQVKKKYPAPSAPGSRVVSECVDLQCKMCFN